jgi:hypothetical protein
VRHRRAVAMDAQVTGRRPPFFRDFGGVVVVALSCRERARRPGSCLPSCLPDHFATCLVKSAAYEVADLGSMELRLIPTLTARLSEADRALLKHGCRQLVYVAT